ncbi:hypothetical protein ACFOED_14330 [Vulcaniibacterium thermophilum]|nr:hypothetical protein [Vulcaniibacterium thermophilum]
MPLTRRDFLALASAGATLALWPRLPAFAASDDTRLLVVLLRGGLDALHALPPIGDPHYARLRGALAVADAVALDQGFALHPALAFVRELYGRRQALPVLAIARPTADARTSRRRTAWRAAAALAPRCRAAG